MSFNPHISFQFLCFVGFCYSSWCITVFFIIQFIKEQWERFFKYGKLIATLLYIPATLELRIKLETTRCGKVKKQCPNEQSLKYVQSMYKENCCINIKPLHRDTDTEPLEYVINTMSIL